MTATASAVNAPRVDCDSARAKWPGLDVPDDAFISYVLARSDLTGEDSSIVRTYASGELDGLHLDDLYLACGCARGDPIALAAFDRQFLAPVAAIVMRSGARAQVGIEVTQVLRDRLLVSDGLRPPRIVEYGGRGSLAGWVRVVAIRAATDLHRDERAHDGMVQARQHNLPPPPDSPEDSALRSRFGDAFNEAFRAAFRALSAEDRLILRLHFAEGLNLDRLAVVMGFSRATGGRRLQAGRVRLRDETLRLLEERLKLSRQDIEGVLGEFRSRLEISISALVTTA